MESFTFYFNEIIPDYETWKANVEQLGIIDYNDPLDAQFDVFCYNLIDRQYHNVNVRYNTPYAFLGSLLNVYLNKYKLFKKEKELIDEIYKLSLKDIELINTTLSNMANNPNDEPNDPTKPLNFISAQTYQQLTDNRFKAYFNALNNMPTLNVFKFLKGTPEELGFEDLFMNVQPNLKYYYGGN